MKNFKKLSRNELKTITGGAITGGNPRAGIASEESCYYKCCWENNLSNCSTTIVAAPGEVVHCIDGAALILAH